MNRFEALVHTARREEGELSVDRFGELWEQSQAEMLGDAVEITEGYRQWWSYVPHFVGTPGYVYAYAYGQLLALSVYRRYLEEGEEFVPRYLELLGDRRLAQPGGAGRHRRAESRGPVVLVAGPRPRARPARAGRGRGGRGPRRGLSLSRAPGARGSRARR